METMMPAPTFDPAAAVERLASLWRADSGASPAAFAILRIALTAQGSVSADNLWRLDAENRAAALGLFHQFLARGDRCWMEDRNQRPTSRCCKR